MQQSFPRRPSTRSFVLVAALLAACTGAGDDGSAPSAPGAAGQPANMPPSVGAPLGPGQPGQPAQPGQPGQPSQPGGSGSTNGGTPPGSSTDPGSNPAPAPVVVPPSSEACPTVEAAGTPLRRLTRFEYANTVKHLLGVTAPAVDDIPVDEVTDGFSNNAGVLTVSPLHAEKYVLASEALAKEAVKNIATLAPCDTASKTEDVCAFDFARSFGRRAFRRELSPSDEHLLLAAYAAGRTGGSYAEGIEVMIRAALQSSHFLYRLEMTAPSDPASKLVRLSPFELGTRLSYLIWGAGPDDALLDAAARGELATKEQVAARARLMLADPKARPAIAEFYNQWMGTTRLDVTAKNSTLFPAYSAEARDAMQRELPAFIEHVLWSGDHKFATLLTSPLAFANGPLAQIYGVAAPGAGGAQMVTLPSSQQRAGILTQAGFLAVQAHPDQTSPVLRGKFIRTKLLCQPPPPPPPDADISPPEIDQGGTARERFSGHLQAGTSCNNCHALMDPIGLAFENFDAIGRYREQEGGQAIDVSGEIVGVSDPALSGAFKGVRELAVKLASSDHVRDCVATQWFRFASGRYETEKDTCSLATLQEAFSASDGDLVELVVSMTQTDSFWYRSRAAQ